MKNNLRQIAIVAFKEFGDRFRSGWVIACVLVWLGAIGLTSFLGLLQVGRIGAQGYDRTVITLLNLVQYLVPLLGLLLGHDLIVTEMEDRTLHLNLACGVSRACFLLGKFVGGCLTLAVPLLLGFIIAGTSIGVAAKDSGFGSFLRLAISSLLLGLIFVGIGLAISVLCRTRVQSLVAALLTWCCAVFVFDLVALSTFISTEVPSAAQEIDLVCDTTHVNSAVDLHSDFDKVTEAPALPRSLDHRASMLWLATNPIDAFRAVNLPNDAFGWNHVAPAILSFTAWFGGALALSIWRLRRIDL